MSIAPDDARHGSHAGAIQHWRSGEKPCDPCALAARRARKKNRLNELNGQPPMVPLGQAWDVLDRTPWNQLARQTGMRSHTLIRLHHRGAEALVFRTTRDRILATHTRWTLIGVQRRLRALTRIGYSMRIVADETGLDMDALKRLRRAEGRKFVCNDYAEGVVAVYERLHMTPAPPGRSATRARTDAERHGWPPPLAWDDIDTDPEPPAALYTGPDIDPVVVMRLLEGQRVDANHAERVEAIRQWVADGNSKAELCKWHGWNDGRFPLRVIQGGAA